MKTSTKRGIGLEPVSAQRCSHWGSQEESRAKLLQTERCDSKSQRVERKGSATRKPAGATQTDDTSLLGTVRSCVAGCCAALRLDRARQFSPDERRFTLADLSTTWLVVSFFPFFIFVEQYVYIDTVSRPTNPGLYHLFSPLLRPFSHFTGCLSPPPPIQFQVLQSFDD